MLDYSTTSTGDSEPLALDSGLESTQDKVRRIAKSDGLGEDIADDFLKVTGGIESGNSHFNKKGKVKLSPRDPRDGQSAVGFSQIKPSTAREVGIDDPYDETNNIIAGLRYFAKGGNDPASRRAHYFGGPGGLKQFQRTGTMGGDFTGTSFDTYLSATGVNPTGQKPAKPKPTPDDLNLDAGDTDNLNLDSGDNGASAAPAINAPGTLATYDRGKPAAPSVEPAQQSTYRLVQPQPKSAEYGAITGALEAAQPTQFSDNPQLDKALHDVEWHFGPAVMNTLHLLDPAARIQVLKEASRLAQADEAKRARGEPIVKSAEWQQANQRRLGLDKNTAVRDEAVSLQRRTQLLTNQSPEAQAAAQRGRAEEFAALPWYERGAITGTTGITEAGGGMARLASKVGVPGAASLAQGTQAMSQDIRSRQAGAAEISQPSLLEKAEEGLLTYSPLLLTGHPEGLLPRIATGAGTFGGYTAAQTYGTGASAGESLKAGAKAAPLGALLSVPSSVVPLTSPFGRAATATASKVAGTYGLGRLEGATNQEALGQAAMIAGFEAPGLVGEGFGAARRGIAGPSIESRTTGQFEPEVQTAAKAAFDRAGISPEAQEKATRNYGPQYADSRQQAMADLIASGERNITTAKVDQRQQAVEQAESQRAVSTNPAVQPPADVADYWKVAVPQPDGTTRTEGFHSRQEAEHRAAELAGELPTAEYPAVPAAQPPTDWLDTTPAERGQIQQQLSAEMGPPTHEEGKFIAAPTEPKPTIASLAGATFELRDGTWYPTNNLDYPVTVPSTIAELNRQAGRFGGQGGFIGERGDIKQGPEGVRTGAVEDLPAERRPVDVQPRQPAGQFAESTDFNAIKAELLRAGERINADYHTLLSHSARREGLRAASGMAIRDYFTRLHRFVAIHAPDKLPLVEQAEAAEAKGDPVTATLLSERALASPHDFVNRLGSAVMAVDAQAKGMELPARMATNWRGVLAEARERNQREGAWKRQRGSVKLGEEGKPAPEGIRTGAVADLVKEGQKKERSLPKSLGESKREPGTDLLYDVVPNKESQLAASKRIADQGVESTERWLADAPPSAERTSAFIALSDRYLEASTKATGDDAAALRTKAVELANQEAPRSTELGQTIQAYAMLNKYSGPEVLMAATKLAQQAGEKLPDKVVQSIAEAGQQFKEADTKLAQVREQIKVVEKPVAGETPTQRAVRVKQVEQLRDEQAAQISQRRTARAKQVATLAKLEQRNRNYFLRFNQIVRGAMVSAIPTAVRNLASQDIRFNLERLTDVTAHVMRRTVGQESYLPNFWQDVARQFSSKSRPLAESVVSEFPAEAKRMFNNYGMGSIDNAMGIDGTFKPKSAIGRGLESMFGTAERAMRTFNFANEIQEFHLRSAEFLAHLDTQIEREYKMSLEKFLRQQGADKLPKEMISDSVNHALEVTFADLPAGDTDVGRSMRSLIQLSNWVPPTLSPIPFGRWFYNSWKFLYQYNPTGFADLLRTPQRLREAQRAVAIAERIAPAQSAAGEARRQAAVAKANQQLTRAQEYARNERARIISKALIGTALLGTAYSLRSSNLAGEKWWEVRVPDTNTFIDARPFGPFSIYLFLAEGMRRWKHNERPFSKSEFTQAIGASTPVGGSIETLYDRYRRGDFDGVYRWLKSESGQIGAALLTPVRQVKTLLGQFDKGEAITRETDAAPFVGPIAESIPYASRALGLEPAYKPTSAEPLHDVNPATKFFPGTRVVPPKNYIEHELDRLRFDPSEVFTSTGVPAADSLLKKYQGRVIEELAAQISKDSSYQKATDPVKAYVLQKLIQQAHAAAQKQLAGERPDLFEQIQQRKVPARKKELIKSLGVSRAQELGVPMPIPPRNANETDVAYRARLLQLGRARAAKLDSAANSTDFNTLNRFQQRSNLYNSLAS